MVEDYSLQTDRFSVKMEERNNDFYFLFEGNIDTQDPNLLLEPFFERMHQQVLNSDTNKIVWDFQKLEFLNSSGIKSLVNWILRANQEKKYQIKLSVNNTYTWQGISLGVLKLMAPEIVIL